MEKFVSCWSVTEKCYFVVREKSEEEVLRKLAEHEEKAHDIKVTEEMLDKARQMIRMAA